MVADTVAVKKFISKIGEVVHYNDPIAEGRSIKIVYNAKEFTRAFNTASALKKKFPNNVVRVLPPTTDVRWGYSVRIWTA